MRRARILVWLLLLPGCGSGIAELKTEMQALRERVDDMSRASTAVRTRIEDLEGRLLLIQDQVETQKLASMRAGAQASAWPVPSLPVVKFAPPDSQPRPEDAAPPWRAAARPRETDPRELDEDVYQDVDDQGRVAGTKPGTPARPVAAAPREAKPRTATRPAPRDAAGDESAALAEYKNAYALYEGGRVEDAKRALATFVARFPKHPYADNAQYWIGECWYDQKDWDAARREFLRVVQEHPDGNKVPDAMVKVGLCNQMLRRSEEARRMYDAVMLTYPDSQAATVALKLLGELP
jgi:tol-pal system protein YbgF